MQQEKSFYHNLKLAIGWIGGQGHANVREIYDDSSGRHSVPKWYEESEKLIESGKSGKSAMADAQFRASQAALLDMEAGGIDIVNGGEMHRRTNNPYAPPNAKLKIHHH